MEKSKRIFTENRILLLINFGILCFLCGNMLREYRTVSMGVWGYMLSILTNHYYILYCVVPILLIIIAKYIKNVRDIEVIRYHNAFQQIRISSKSFIQWLTLYLVAHLMIAFIIGIRTFGLSIHQNNIEVSAYDELISILNIYSKYFYNSVLAIIATVGYFIFGFAVLIVLLSYVNYKYKYKNVIMLSVLIYVFTFIGFKTDVKSIIPIICFNNFILLHHGLFVNGVAKFLLTIFFGIVVILFCCGKRFKFTHYGFNDLIISRREKILSMIFVLILFLLELFRTVGNVNFNFRDIIITTFFGTNDHDTSFIPWLRLTILYATPIFFLGIADSRMRKYAQAPIMIRLKSKYEFDCKLTREYIKFICLYVAFICVIGNVFYLLGTIGGHNDGYLVSEFNIHFTYGILNMYFMIFLINLIFDFAIFKIMTKLTNGVVAILIILLYKFIFFMFPSINIFYLNFGMVNLFDGMQNPVELGIKVAAISIMSAIYFMYGKTRRLKYDDHQD